MAVSQSSTVSASISPRVVMSARAVAPGAFSDRRVVLVHADDESMPLLGAVVVVGAGDVRLVQDCDGPAHLVIGRQAPDSALERAAARLAVPVRELLTFRDDTHTH